MKQTTKRVKPVALHVRISPALHKKLKRDAKRHNKSLNATMAHLLEEPFTPRISTKALIPANFAKYRELGPRPQSELSRLIEAAIRLELEADVAASAAADAITAAT